MVVIINCFRNKNFGFWDFFSKTLLGKKGLNKKRDLLINECGNLAMDAMKYYKKPTDFRGG